MPAYLLPGSLGPGDLVPGDLVPGDLVPGDLVRVRCQSRNVVNSSTILLPNTGINLILEKCNAANVQLHGKSLGTVHKRGLCISALKHGLC